MKSAPPSGGTASRAQGAPGFEFGVPDAQARLLSPTSHPLSPAASALSAES